VSRNHLAVHPLEMFPFFRRWPASPLRDLIYTGIWSSMLALVLAVAGRLFTRSAEPFWNHLYPVLFVSNMIGYMIHAATTSSYYLLGDRVRNLSGVPRMVYYITLVSTCVVLGMFIGTGILRGVNPLDYLSRMSAVLTVLPFAILAAAIMFIVYASGERRVAADLLAAQQKEQIASAAQLLAEARLRSLQTQIEPHFLYNTLANVVGLIDANPAQAKRMLERFIDFLRASLAASRADSATLGAELDLTAAYLDVLAVRMGARLRYRIEADPACRALPIAPMLLQPVVENAVAHGLEPKIEGGDIVIRATCQGTQLCIEVSDSGAGLSNAPPKPGGGVGLSNLRARLRSLYDGQAQVQLLENQPCGITVRIMLPLKESPPSTIHAS
jgi:signal transduction histidine kinase